VLIRRRRLVSAILSLLLPVGAAVAQDVPPAVRNPGFELGEPGKAPLEWRFNGPAGATVQNDANGPAAGTLAARIDAVGQTGAEPGFANLLQRVAAAPFRGKRIQFRAAVRTADLSADGKAQLWCRVDLAAGAAGAGAFDNMRDRPIRTDAWQHHAIVLDVDAKAEQIVVGMFVLGSGTAWLDDVTFEVVSSEVAVTGKPVASEPRVQLDPRVAAAFAVAADAPRQPFWTTWLLLPAVALALFLIGMWPLARRAEGDEAPSLGTAFGWFTFRFTAIYWLLYCFPAPFATLVAAIPETGPGYSQWLATHWSAVEAQVVKWLAQWPFRLEGELVPPNGSGDTTHSYLLLFAWFLVALVAASLWSLVAGRFLRRMGLVDLLRSYLRYVLAFTLLGYGLAKVGIENNQFPLLEGQRLQRTWGESSPMGVVWSFMGASRPYTVFAGLGEVLAALLLIWRHTALLGAFVAAGVMTNVVMLNYCYDVPVKQYSTHLLLMAVLILVPDVRRLRAFFILDRSVEGPALASGWTGFLHWVRLPLKLAVIVVGIGMPLWATAKELWIQAIAEAPAAASTSGEAEQPLLQRRGYRWINEVPFNR
jgi:hypothetical protein